MSRYKFKAIEEEEKRTTNVRHVIFIGNRKLYCQTSENILFRTYRVFMIATHHKLCIVYQINAEDQSPNRRINQSNGFARKENRYKTKEHKDDGSNEQNT